MNERTYPDIDFVNTDPESILTELITLYEKITDRILYPASPERLFISWCSAVIVQQRVIINETAKKNVLRYATGEYLDSLSELFNGTERLRASPASATFRCYISEAQLSSVIVPQGTRITADGNIMFATKEALIIPAGNTYGDVEAICQTAGEEGNGYAPGQVKEIVDVYDYYKKIENITTTSGGAEQEEDDSYYERLRESMESFSTAGPINGYIYWTKSVSAAVSDVAVTSPEPGVVDIRVLLQNGIEVTDTVLQNIEDALNASDVRPLTDKVTVSKPVEDMFNLNVKYYIPKDMKASSYLIDAAVQESIEKYIIWQTEKMGRDINPSKLISMVMEAGVKRIEVIEPEFKIVSETHVAKLGMKTIANGGIEDE